MRSLALALALAPLLACSGRPAGTPFLRLSGGEGSADVGYVDVPGLACDSRYDDGLEAGPGHVGVFEDADRGDLVVQLSSSGDGLFDCTHLLVRLSRPSGGAPRLEANALYLTSDADFPKRCSVRGGRVEIDAGRLAGKGLLSMRGELDFDLPGDSPEPFTRSGSLRFEVPPTPLTGAASPWSENLYPGF